MPTPVHVISTPLKYNAKTNAHYDPTTGHEYMILDNPEQFKLIKHESLTQTRRLDPLTKQVLKCTPIYLDPITGTYYYPKRHPQESTRLVIYQRPFMYCDSNNCLYEPSTGNNTYR